MKISKEAKIGVFALLMGGALYWGANYLKGKSFFSGDQTFYAVFDQTGDLSESSPVLIKGVRVGVVSKIDYDPRVSDNILIRMEIHPKYCLPRNSRAVIFSNGIMGGKAIRIDMGNDKTYLVAGDTIPSHIKSYSSEMGSSDIDFFKDRLAELTVNLGKTLDALTVILNNNTDDVHRTMTNLASLTGNIDRLVAAQSGNVGATLDNLNAISGSLKSYTSGMGNIVRNVESLTDSLNRANLPRTIASLDRTATQLSTVVAKLDSKEGTIGLMINDRALYDSLVRAASGASLLLEDVKAHPKSYVHFSLFGGGKK